MRGFVVSALEQCLCFEGGKKESTLIFQKYVTIDANQRRQQAQKI